MLQELHVSNFAIIENVQLIFQPGLNILSGETGAGKSILLKSLGLLMGEKSEGSAVRSGKEFAVIEGSFDLESRPDIRQKLEGMGIECPDATMVVRRIVGGSQKARVYINGALSTLSALRDLVSPLVEVTGQAVPLIELTGQHDNRHLLSKTFHLELLDQYAGTTAIRLEHQRVYHRLREIQDEIQTIQTEERNRALRLDFLAYSRDEIRALELQPGDEVVIEQDARRMKHSKRLLEFASSSQETLDGDEDSITSRLQTLLARASELRQQDAELAEKLSPLEQARATIVDVAYELRDYANSLDADPDRLEEVESRLSRLRQLQKKYGATASEILDSLKTTEEEIRELEASDERLSQLETEAREFEEELKSLSQDLHNKRVAAARLFAEEVNAELLDLNMKGVTFLISVEALAETLASGMSDVEFQTKSSKLDEPRALAKAASGGELSRILLSIKQIVGSSDSLLPRTYLFDEVDTGVSGETADKVGRKLRAIARGQQVICVTHLPQVAAHGDAHYFIHKQISEDRPGSKKDSAAGNVAMSVDRLSADKRVREIARLISGEKLSATSLAHAQQLLDESSKVSQENGHLQENGKRIQTSATRRSSAAKVRRESGLVK
jgi:DNA repair protein RecN (Recombination protein N)